jgi:hypothetical protein
MKMIPKSSKEATIRPTPRTLWEMAIDLAKAELLLDRAATRSKWMITELTT